VILPVWHRVDRHYIAQRSPILADRLGAPTSAGLNDVAEKILLALERASVHTPAEPRPGTTNPRDVVGSRMGTALHALLRVSRRRTGVLVLGFALTVLSGFVIARDTQGETSAPLTTTASNQAIEVSFPASWRRSSTAPATPGVHVREPLALTSTSSIGTLVIGSAETTSATLLPADLLAAVSHLPSAEVVRLAGKVFYRYRNVKPRGATGVETVYAQPTTGGVVLGLCTLPRFSSTTTNADCERILGSLRLISTRPLQFGQSPTYASVLTGTISRLNGSQSSTAGQMATAKRASSQAGAAERLSDAYQRAAESLQSTIPGPPEQVANDLIVSALRRTEGGYHLMAAGARAQNASDFNRGRGSVLRGTAGLTSALAHLSKLGYRFNG
jgi:hypothetical protein